jgi:hypothetical protein
MLTRIKASAKMHSEKNSYVPPPNWLLQCYVAQKAMSSGFAIIIYAGFKFVPLMQEVCKLSIADLNVRLQRAYPYQWCRVHIPEACFALLILRDSHVYVSRNQRGDAERLSSFLCKDEVATTT